LPARYTSAVVRHYGSRSAGGAASPRTRRTSASSIVARPVQVHVAGQVDPADLIYYKIELPVGDKADREGCKVSAPSGTPRLMPRWRRSVL
jgi:hypothetical protein